MFSTESEVERERDLIFCCHCVIIVPFCQCPGPEPRLHKTLPEKLGRERGRKKTENKEKNFHQEPDSSGREVSSSGLCLYFLM